MLVVLTDARVLVWSYVGLFRPRPYTLLGTIAIDDIANVQFSGRLGLLSLWLPHRTFDLRVDDADSARRFAATAREQIAART